LTALKLKGESPDEIAGLARGMKKAANIIDPKVKGTLIDTCGTGGDSTGTINVSTEPRFVASAAGILLQSMAIIPLLPNREALMF